MGQPMTRKYSAKHILGSACALPSRFPLTGTRVNMGCHPLRKRKNKLQTISAFSTICLKNIPKWNKGFLCAEKMIMNGTKVVFAEQVMQKKYLQHATEMEQFSSKKLKIWIRRSKVASTCVMKTFFPKDDGTESLFPMEQRFGQMEQNFTYNGTTCISSIDGTKI
jgi:hypothetical protein